jgi:hypothetical protein
VPDDPGACQAQCLRCAGLAEQPGAGFETTILPWFGLPETWPGG